MGFRTKDQLVDDTKDLWLFVNKYENLLKRNGHCILPETCDHNQQHDLIPKQFDKSLSISLKLTVPFEELQGRLSSYEKTKITYVKLKQFLQIVIHYLEFKQKEKFTKLKKLRKFQAELPVAKYKQEIIDAVREEQVVLIAGDTGCGKSTQIPQYLFEAGYQSIGKCNFSLLFFPEIIIFFFML